MSSAKLTIGTYLLRRLKELGVDIIFGVPGDYNLVQYLLFLNYV
jgi:TPP-dependent 2-oxoacid decarboxylase